jgi:hypothetical protein
MLLSSEISPAQNMKIVHRCQKPASGSSKVQGSKFNVKIARKFGQFKTFKPFNRFAPFKTFKQIRFLCELRLDAKSRVDP